MGLPDSSQPITIVIVGVMMAIRWLEAHVKENNRPETPTKELLQEFDCLMERKKERKKIRARRRLMPWLRAYTTAWL